MRFTLVLAGLSIVVAVAAAGPTTSFPTEVVKAYCQRHEAGLGLSGQSYSAIGELVLWPDEPGWDIVVVVSGFRILQSAPNGHTASVNVKYDILGVLEGDYWFPVNSTILARLGLQPQVQFVLKKTPSGWKIAEPPGYPRIGLDAAIHHVKDLVAEDRRQGHPRPALEEGLKALELLARNRSGT